MWALKITASVDKTIVGNIAKKHQVLVNLYPLLTNKVQDACLITYSGTVHGEESRIKEFLTELEELPQIENFDSYGNSFIGRYKEKEGYDHFYNPEIIYFEPWVIDGAKSTHSLNLCSWDREHLSKIVELIGDKHNGRLLKITKKKLPSIFLFNIRPELTERQREAIELAVRHGYYDRQRRISVQDLAKIAKCAFSTFQVHLRNAERKTIPFLFSNDKYR